MADLQVGAGASAIMDNRRAVNRSMFWRVLRRSVFANRGRLFVILLALAVGAAVTAALLNLQVDAKRRMTTEFRRFGANILVTPRRAGNAANGFLDQTVLDRIPGSYDGQDVIRIGFIYVGIVARLEKGPQELPPSPPPRAKQIPTSKAPQSSSSASGLDRSPNVILVGLDGLDVQRVLPSESIEASNAIRPDMEVCRLGQRAAKQLSAVAGSSLQLRGHALEPSRDGTAGRETRTCFVSTVEAFGGSEDSQIFTDLYTAQRLAGTPHVLSVIQISFPGTPDQVNEFVTFLQGQMPDVEVRPVRQFTEGEARLYGKISGILTATVAVVLVLTVLCVMAAMTNVAMERKNDVGLMKAIGGSVRRVMRLFLAEAALLGLAGGVIGAALGIVISMGLGKAVFGVAAQPRLIVYPVSVALTVIVAVLAAYPLRRLAHIRPASVLRGEE